jgi:hypothetical protein
MMALPVPLARGHAAAVLAVALAVAGVAEAWREDVADRIARLEPVPGEVVATRAPRGRPARRFATVRFEAGGRSAEVDGRAAEPVEVGQRTWVWVDPGDPARTASLQPPAARRQGPALLLALAALLAAAGARMAWEGRPAAGAAPVPRPERRRAGAASA